MPGHTSGRGNNRIHKVRSPKATSLQVQHSSDLPPTSSIGFGNAAPCSFSFHVQHVKKHAKMYGFRFFALSPELRNRIYEFSFSDKHNLSPPGITQANRQTRGESLKMFYAVTDTLTIPVRTATQVTCFLRWISDVKLRSDMTAKTIEFSYLDPCNEETTINRTRKVMMSMEVATEFGMVDLEAGTDLPRTLTPPNGNLVPHPRLVIKAWYACLGLANLEKLRNCRAVAASLRPPSDAFSLAAITQKQSWVSYQMTLVSERAYEHFCYCIEPYNFFAKLAKRADGKDLKDPHLREIAFYLFGLSVRADNEAEKARLEEID